MSTDAARSAGRVARAEPTLLLDQLQGIAAWHRARREEGAAVAEAAQTAATRSREQRLDCDRRMEVLRAQHQAILERTATSMTAGLHVMADVMTRRAVLAHRSEWFLDQVASRLQAAGVDVVATSDNGATAVGVVVAEQPDVVLIEDRLVMMRGDDVVQDVRQFAPRTLAAVQVADAADIPTFIDLGASTAFTRAARPPEVVRGLCDLLGVPPPR